MTADLQRQPAVEIARLQKARTAAAFAWAVMQLSSGGHAASGRYAAGSAGIHEKSAEEIVKQRFARGEIDAEEYEERRRVLSEESPAAPR